MRIRCNCGGKAVVLTSEQVTDKLRQGRAECEECGQTFKFNVHFEEQIKPPRDENIVKLIDMIRALSPEQSKATLEQLKMGMAQQNRKTADSPNVPTPHGPISN